MKIVICAIIAFGFTPTFVHAAVSISEIAWMGGAESANHEWIELHNSGSQVNVDGWTLSDGNNLNITLTGSISANTYVVLERTSDASAPGAAFLIYTGALNNSGVTLALKNENGGIEDQVVGGDEWENIGGNNTSKETPQYTSTGWITTEATPGTTNEESSNDNSTPESGESDEPNTETTSGDESEVVSEIVVQRSSGGSTATVLIDPGNTLALTIDGPDQVFVNQEVRYQVQATGVGSTIENSLNYQWNFGDLHTATTKDSTHTFEYPGTYVVTVAGEYTGQSAQTTKTVSVLPVKMSLTTNAAGEIQIHNNTGYTIDLSNYRLRTNEVITLPDHTYVLAKQTITVPRYLARHSRGHMAGLYDTGGELVASIRPTVSSNFVQSESLPTVPVAPVVTSQFVADKEIATSAQTDVIPTSSVTSVGAASPDTSSESTNRIAYVGLFLLLLVGSTVLLLKPLASKDSLDRHE